MPYGGSRTANETFDVRFERGPYGPGDTVGGTISVYDEIDCRKVSARLCCVGESDDYHEDAVHGESVLHEGSLAAGDYLTFSFPLPAEALPPQELGKKGIWWALVVEADRGRKHSPLERHPLPLLPDLERWRGPTLTDEELDAEAGSSGNSWDVGLVVAPRSVRRGGELQVEVTIGQPSDRREIEVGLLCEVYYHHLHEWHDDNRTTFRIVEQMLAHENWMPVEGGSPTFQTRFPVPADRPFSYGRADTISAVTFFWKVRVREPRRLRRDPYREALVQVLP